MTSMYGFFCFQVAYGKLVLVLWTETSV